MNPNVGTYDIRKVITTMGTIPIIGYADGEGVISITTPEDAFETARGADGQVDRYAKNVLDAEITLQLMQSSPTNDLLSALHQTDKATGLGKVPFLMKDLNSITTLASFLQAWVVKMPDLNRGNAASTVEWVIRTGPGFYLVGANIV